MQGIPAAQYRWTRLVQTAEAEQKRNQVALFNMVERADLDWLSDRTPAERASYTDDVMVDSRSRTVVFRNLKGAGKARSDRRLRGAVRHAFWDQKVEAGSTGIEAMSDPGDCPQPARPMLSLRRRWGSGGRLEPARRQRRFRWPSTWPRVVESAFRAASGRDSVRGPSVGVSAVRVSAGRVRAKKPRDSMFCQAAVSARRTQRLDEIRLAPISGPQTDRAARWMRRSSRLRPSAEFRSRSAVLTATDRFSSSLA
jgi:hypothetical protein